MAYEAVHVTKPGLGPREGPKDRILCGYRRMLPGKSSYFQREEIFFLICELIHIQRRQFGDK